MEEEKQVTFCFFATIFYVLLTCTNYDSIPVIIIINNSGLADYTLNNLKKHRFIPHKNNVLSRLLKVEFESIAMNFVE